MLGERGAWSVSKGREPSTVLGEGAYVIAIKERSGPRSWRRQCAQKVRDMGEDR